MKLLNYGDTEWLVGDEAAELLMNYSVLMARVGTADSVNVTMLNNHGEPQNLNILIGPSTMMTSRETATDFPEPENARAVAEVRGKIAAIEEPPPVQPTDPLDANDGIGEYDL